MKRTNTKLAFVVILGCFICLALIYGVVNPIFESPGEVQHFYYARHIARTGSLAVQDPSQVALYRQEGSQPPLYYLLGAALISWVNTDDAEVVIRENPHVNLGVAQAFGNKNALVHTRAEGFPYRGVPLAVHLLRLLSIGLGALTVCATYALGREVFPDQPIVALLAATFNAFLPQFVFMSASVNNDIAVAATASWTVVVLARCLRLGFYRSECSLCHSERSEESRPPRDGEILRFAQNDQSRLPSTTETPKGGRVSFLPALLGVLVGLTVLSKLSGLSVGPLVVLGLVWWAWRERRWIEAFRHGLTVCAVATAVGGWWYARNWTLYSDPLGLQTMLDVVGRRDTFGFSDLLFELEGLRLSFWGLFGWFNVLMARWTYYVYDIVAIIGLIGLVVLIAARTHRSLRPSSSGAGSRLLVIVGLLVWQVAVLVALVYWTSSTTGSQGRLLFVTLAALCVLWAGGIMALIPRQLETRYVASLQIQWLVWGGLALLWFGLALSAPFLYIEPAYTRPPILGVDDLPSSLNRLDVTFGDKMKLLGYEMPEPRTSRYSGGIEGGNYWSVRRGTPLQLTLCWQSLAEMDRDYTVFVHLFGRGDRPIGQEDTYPGGGNAPTTEWLPGQIICDRYEVLVVPEAKAPSIGAVDVGVYDLDTQERLAAYDRDMRPMEQVLLSPFKVDTWAPHQYDIENEVYFDLGAEVRLVGYRIEREVDEGESVLKVALYWRARVVPASDYTVFVHLLDADDRLIAQHDGQPVGSDYPTSFWDEGETVKDEHVLALPGDFKAGEYHLRVGMYRADTGQRLDVTDVEGQALGNSILFYWSEKG